MIWAFEVESGDPHFAPRAHARALERELLLRPIGNTVYFMPPYVITDDEWQLLVERTLECLDSLRLIAACVAALSLGPATALAALPASVEAALRTAGIPPEAVSIVLQEAAAERPVLAHNAERAMSPASVMKLVTTYAGLEMLGSRFHLVYRGLGDRAGGATACSTGDLFLRGQGDPKLTIESFWLLLRGVRARGVHEIRGDLVLDRSYYGFDPGDPGRFDNEPLQVYNTLPDALLVNHKAVRLTFTPDTEARRVHMHGRAAAVRDAHRQSARARQRALRRLARALKTEMRRRAGRRPLVFTGSYSVLCGEQSRHYSDPVAAGVCGRAFPPVVVRAGRAAGRAAVRDGFVPPGARLLAVQESPALSEVVRDINKYSNNAMSRQLYLALGAAAFGPPGDAGEVRSRRAPMAGAEAARTAGAGDRERLGAFAHRAHQCPQAWARCWPPPGAARSCRSSSPRCR